MYPLHTEKSSTQNKYSNTYISILYIQTYILNLCISAEQGLNKLHMFTCYN